MARWQDYFTRLGHGLERRFDAGKKRLRKYIGLEGLMIDAYLTYGSREKLFIKGRVLEDEGIGAAQDGDSLWTNLKNAYRRFETDEIEGAQVRARFGGQSWDLQTDEEGYFSCWLNLSEVLPEDHALLQDVELELVSPLPAEQTKVHFRAAVMVPREGATFGVISDIDDTVLQSDATRTLSMLKKVLFGNARTRLPFEGVAEFYKALQGDDNPLFYVSSSPWNLYDLLSEFLALNEIPLGPLMLRDWGVTASELLPRSHGKHKLESIEQILTTCPSLPFILIGDSGQEDPEIYRQVVHDFPERILGIFIRDVSRHPEREEAITELGREVAAAGSSLMFVPDTVSAAKLAAERGWIEPYWPEVLAEEVDADQDEAGD